MKEMVVDFVFNQSIVFQRISDGGSLLHYRAIKLMKKKMLQSECIGLHLSFVPLYYSREVLSIIPIGNDIQYFKSFYQFPTEEIFIKW